MALLCLSRYGHAWMDFLHAWGEAKIPNYKYPTCKVSFPMSLHSGEWAFASFLSNNWCRPWATHKPAGCGTLQVLWTSVSSLSWVVQWSHASFPGLARNAGDEIQAQLGSHTKQVTSADELSHSSSPHVNISVSMCTAFLPVVQF